VSATRTRANPAPTEANPPAATPGEATPGEAALTEVELTWIAQRKEYWIRFGAVTRERIIDRRRRVLSFAPGAVFAFVRWEANDYGTILSRIAIAQAPAPGEAYTTLPCVTPGAVVLLDQNGWPKVRRVLATIDRIEAQGVAPADAAPDYWRHVHNRLAAGQAPRAYSMARHAAWLGRRELAS
jgi:hypothetical protein